MRRQGGRIWSGEGFNGWSLADPMEMDEVEHDLRYGKPDRAALLSAASGLDSYRHLLTYRHTEFVIDQLRTVRRFLREAKK